MCRHDVNFSCGVNHTIGLCLRNPMILKEFNYCHKTNIRPNTFFETPYNSELSSETRQKQMIEFNQFIDSIRGFVWEHLKPVEENKCNLE